MQEFDDELPGFGVRKFASGKASLFVKYSIGTQQRRKTLGPWVPGTLSTIRKEAAVVLAQARLGKDVVGEARKAQEEAAKVAKATLGQLIGPYLLVREKGDEFWKPLRPKSLHENTRYLERSWAPLHGVPVDKITRAQVRARRDEIVKESGATSANRALVALSGFCGWAIHQEHIPGANPCADIKTLNENKRERPLSEEELVEIWLAADDIGGAFGCIVKLLMLTGQRRQEIGGLEWAEVRVQRAMIDLPERRTKNKKRHLVPLSEPALALLPPFPEDGGKFVFGNFSGWSLGKAALDKRIAERRGSPLAPWRLQHDLRHTFVTTMNDLGFAEPHIVEAIVNHISGAKGGIAGRYNHAQYIQQRIEALGKWGAYLPALVKGPLTSKQRNKPEKPEEVGSQVASGT